MTTNAGRKLGPAQRQAVERWEQLTRRWLSGDDSLPEPFESWWASYEGKGEKGAPTRNAMAEPFVGDWARARLVILGLNPGRADFDFQGRRGYFATQVAKMGYAAWAATDPYGSELWETHGAGDGASTGAGAAAAEKPRRPNRFRRNRLGFAERWLDDGPVSGEELLIVELYPWHSPSINAKMAPPAKALRPFVWDPLADLDTELIFAFGAGWRDAADALKLKELARFDGEHFRSAARRVRVYELPGARQRLIVEWHSGGADPPAADDTERLKTLLGV